MSNKEKIVWIIILIICIVANVICIVNGNAFNWIGLIVCSISLANIMGLGE